MAILEPKHSTYNSSFFTIQPNHPCILQVDCIGLIVSVTSLMYFVHPVVNLKEILLIQCGNCHIFFFKKNPLILGGDFTWFSTLDCQLLYCPQGQGTATTLALQIRRIESNFSLIKPNLNLILSKFNSKLRLMSFQYKTRTWT